MADFDPTLYVITDAEEADEAVLLTRLEGALAGGATLAQLRDKYRGDGALLRLARRAKTLCASYGVPLIIDDRVDVALAAGADGVHVGPEDLPVAEARRLMGPGKIVGATAKTVAAARAAEGDGADYLGVGAIYPTATKVRTVITEVAVLQDICRAVRIPALAIGGLRADNLGILAGSGAAGVCVVTAVMRADRPAAAAADILRAFQNLPGNRTA
ncbi:MAG: thiamine phosphate synthase [Candidatus Adiutrix sp.]|jgi:thiamine-phosphate pyrophosphorylase|nr:thiamine phosphate synthase [Candidatus Adiutrix sp.]